MNGWTPERAEAEGRDSILRGALFDALHAARMDATTGQAILDRWDASSQRAVDALAPGLLGPPADTPDDAVTAERLRKLLEWERTEHDKARTEWLLMRDRLNGLYGAVAGAREHTRPPDGYDEPMCHYGGEGDIIAAPWAWLSVLLAEALDDYRPFAREDWEAEEELRMVERRRLIERVDRLVAHTAALAAVGGEQAGEQ